MSAPTDRGGQNVLPKLTDEESQALEREKERDRFLFLIAANGWANHHNALMASGCQKGRENWERISHPQVGDLVLETSTVWRWLKYQRSPGVALGILKRIAEEPFPRVEDELEPDPAVTERVFYIAPLDGSVPEARWTNASFIALMSEEWPHD